MDLPPKIESQLAAFAASRMGYRDSDWEMASQYADRALKADRYNYFALLASAVTTLEAFMAEHRFDGHDVVLYAKAVTTYEEVERLLQNSNDVRRTEEAHIILDSLYKNAVTTAEMFCHTDDIRRWVSSRIHNLEQARTHFPPQEASKPWSEKLVELQNSSISLPPACSPSR